MCVSYVVDRRRDHRIWLSVSCPYVLPICPQLRFSPHRITRLVACEMKFRRFAVSLRALLSSSRLAQHNLHLSQPASKQASKQAAPKTTCTFTSMQIVLVSIYLFYFIFSGWARLMTACLGDDRSSSSSFLVGRLSATFCYWKASFLHRVIAGFWNVTSSSSFFSFQKID